MRKIRDTDARRILEETRRVLHGNRRFLLVHRTAQFLILVAVPATMVELLLTASAEWVFVAVIALTSVAAVHAATRFTRLGDRLDSADADISFFRSQNHSPSPGRAFEPEATHWLHAPIVRAARGAEFRPLRNVNQRPAARHRIRNSCLEAARRIAGPSSWPQTVLLFVWLCAVLLHVYTGERNHGNVGNTGYLSIWLPFAVTMLVLAGVSIEIFAELTRRRRIEAYAEAVLSWLMGVVGPAATRNGPSSYERTEMVRQPPLSGAASEGIAGIDA